MSSNASDLLMVRLPLVAFDLVKKLGINKITDQQNEELTIDVQQSCEREQKIKRLKYERCSFFFLFTGVLLMVLVSS